MFKSFFLSVKYRLWAWGGFAVLLMIIYSQVHLTVLLNDWYGRFYNILQKADDLNAFYKSMEEFSYIAAALVFISVVVFYLAQHYAFMWREAINHHYLPLWEKCDNSIEGASQRIQQDTYEFSKFLEKFGLGFFRASLTLIAFIPILWELSQYVSIPILKDINGSLIYIAFITSIGGMIASYFVGIKLPGIEYENQKREAAYRKELVYSEDDKKFADVNALTALFNDLKKNYFKMFNHYSYFTLWGSTYGQIMIIVPYIIMGPSLFAGIIALGIVTQTGNAFRKVNDSFSYFIDHWTEVTKFLSVIKRLKEFENLLLEENNNTA